MAYDETLAERIRQGLACKPGVGTFGFLACDLIEWTVKLRGGQEAAKAETKRK
jgi:hypothetical protein